MKKIKNNGKKRNIKIKVNSLLTLILYCICAIIIVIIIPIKLYYFLIWLSEKNIIYFNHLEIWISYYGTILGGIITFVGLMVTIKNQDKIRRNDKAIEYKPIIGVDKIDIKNGFGATCGYRTVTLYIREYIRRAKTGDKYYCNKKEHHNFFLTFTNRGRGETNGAMVKKMVLVDNEWAEGNLIYPAYGDQYIGEMLPNEIFGLKVELPTYLLVKKEVYEKKDSVELSFRIIIEYKDMFEYMAYEYSLYLRFKAIFNKNNSEEVDSNNLYAVNVNYILDDDGVIPSRINKDNVNH